MERIQQTRIRGILDPAAKINLIRIQDSFNSILDPDGTLPAIWIQDPITCVLDVVEKRPAIRTQDSINYVLDPDGELDQQFAQPHMQRHFGTIHSQLCARAI